MKKKSDTISGIPASDAIKVNSVGEEYMYIGAIECPTCHAYGTVKCQQQALLNHDGKYYDLLECNCSSCSAPSKFLFDINSFFGKMEDMFKEMMDD